MSPHSCELDIPTPCAFRGERGHVHFRVAKVSQSPTLLTAGVGDRSHWCDFVPMSIVLEVRSYGSRRIRWASPESLSGYDPLPATEPTAADRQFC